MAIISNVLAVKRTIGNCLENLKNTKLKTSLIATYSGYIYLKLG